MKSYWKAVGVQATSIILTALLAAAISFIQSLLTQTQGLEVPKTNPTEAGVLGAGLQGLRVALMKGRAIV